MKNVILILLAIIVVACKSNTTTDKISNNLYSDVIHSEILNENREVFVHLPPSYDTTSNEYITIYMLDGLEHFGYASSLVEFLYSWNEIPEVIFIGIKHVDRFKDLSYSQDAFFEHECNAPNFTLYLKNELIPHVESMYRTNKKRALIGHSLGSMFTINTFFRDPDLFNYYLAASPNFERDTTLLTLIEKELNEKEYFNSPIYISKETTFSLKDSIEYNGFHNLLKINNSKIKYKEDFFPNESHVSMAPISLIKGLKYLFEHVE